MVLNLALGNVVLLSLVRPFRPSLRPVRRPPVGSVALSVLVVGLLGLIAPSVCAPQCL